MKRRQIVTNLIILLVTGLFSCSNPSTPETSYTVTVSGTVLRKSTFPLDSVQIVVDKPFQRDSVGADGKFQVSFKTPDNNAGSSKLTFSRLRFTDTTITVSYSSTAKTIDLGVVVMVSQDSSENIATPGAPSAHANKIAFIGTTVSNLSIHGAGGDDVTTLTFEVRDSAGNPVDASNSVMVRFNFASRPDSITGFNHDSVKTDASGRAAVLLIAGEKSGIAQVQATARIDSLKLTLSSQIISIPIYGGSADSTHFSLAVAKKNIAGGILLNVHDQITALLGDSAGNPAQPGTVVYFSTNGGVIQPSGTSSKDGEVTVDLITGNPFPPGGIATVTATVGSSNKVGSVASGGSGKQTLSNLKGTSRIFLKKGGKNISSQTQSISTASGIGKDANIEAVFSKTIHVLFSGPSTISLNNLSDTNFVVPVNNAKEIDYTVADPLGNPLTAGTTISLSTDAQTSSDVGLTGDINTTMSDTQDKSATHFKVFVRDNRQTKTSSETFKIAIKVKSDNGDAELDFQGNLSAVSSIDTGTVPISARQPSQIAFLGITASDIFVAGVGGTENSVISYEVRDSLGQPIDQNRRTYATFTPQFFANSTIGGGTAPTLIPTADSTDDQGQLRVSVVSGSEAGVLKVLVTIQLPGKTVTSQPVKITVHSGFPDQHHFTILPSRFVFPGIDSYNEIPFTVVVGDTFSNPVPQGTAVYFHTQAGIIETGSQDFNAYTNTNGEATVNLKTVNPTPTALPYYDATYGPGYEWVYAQTQGSNNQYVIDSVLVVWTRLPIVVQGIPDSVVSIPANGASAPISFTVKDGNGNPLPDGTKITVIAVPPSNPPTGFDVATSGDVSVIIPNAAYARFSGSQITDFAFQVVDRSQGAFTGTSVTVDVTVVSPGLGTWQKSFIAKIQ
jgi:hypothetical protein